MLDHPTSQEFAGLPDAQRRLDWLAGAAPGLRCYDDRIWWAAVAGRVDVVRKLWCPPTAEALQDSAGFDLYTAFLSDAVRRGHMDLAQDLLALDWARLWMYGGWRALRVQQAAWMWHSGR